MLLGFSSVLLSDPNSSLATSLLCQSVPMPLQPQSIALPSSEVKSRKENRQNLACDQSPSAVLPGNLSLLAHPTPNQPVMELVETRKASHPVFGVAGSVISMGAVATDSHSNPPMTNTVLDVTTGGAASGDQNPKRMRNFTPASIRVIDDDDDSRRNSPRLRIGSTEDLRP